ncbi:sensor histidine kinase [Fodinicola acaciae]|uniref:sensor histidine kinase n=1 Tax=Fodinicola acaciae TaxID=2681555 RepID=UPI0013CFC790|nr:histidine kinase [Fodinicola acaciae]
MTLIADERPRTALGRARYVVRYVALVAFVYAGFSNVANTWPASLVWLGYAIVVLVVVSLVAMALFVKESQVGTLVFAFVGAAGADALLAVNSASVGGVITLVLCPWLVTRLKPKVAFRAIAVLIAMVTIVGAVELLTRGTGWGSLAGYVGGAIGTTSFGWSIRLMRERVATAEQLLEQEKEAASAVAHARVLDERARLAREIHDILAHTLSAQTVELEGVRLMLKRRDDPDEVLSHVDKAQRLARDGLAETRRALASLRGDVRPLPEAIGALAADASAELSIDEPVPELSPEVSVAVVRTVQEALTNTRKHAAGAHVTVSLRFPPGAVEAEITDTGASAAAPQALAESGGGYGLAGMAERAELLGGRVEAGPAADGKGFRVWLRIPT